MAKKRIANALTEYAINWNNLQGSLDREDLNGFLKIWKEEFDALKKPVSLERNFLNWPICSAIWKSSRICSVRERTGKN